MAPNHQSHFSIAQYTKKQQNYIVILKKVISPPSLNLIQLPEEILRLIFGYLDHATLAKFRMVCHRFKDISSSILNFKFYKVHQLVSHFYNLEMQLPRQVPLRRKSQIIVFFSEELHKLHCIFDTHIKQNCCCFFPGEILDESYSLIRTVEEMSKPKKDSVKIQEPEPLVIMNKYFILQNKLLSYLGSNNHYESPFKLSYSK